MASDWNGAANAYRRVLQLNPEHPQARAKLQALGEKASSAAAPASPAPSAAATEPLGHAPWLAGTAATGAAPAAGPPGAVQCGQRKPWAKPGLSCQRGSAPLLTAPTSAYSCV